MSSDFNIERDEAIATIRLNRQLTTAEFLKVVEEVAQQVPDKLRLWDATKNFDFTAGDIRSIAERSMEFASVPARVALVAEDDLTFGLLRMFEVFREQDNYQSRVFRDEQAARDWLTEEAI